MGFLFLDRGKFPRRMGSLKLFSLYLQGKVDSEQKMSHLHIVMRKTTSIQSTKSQIISTGATNYGVHGLCILHVSMGDVTFGALESDEMQGEPTQSVYAFNKYFGEFNPRHMTKEKFVASMAGKTTDPCWRGNDGLGITTKTGLSRAKGLLAFELKSYADLLTKSMNNGLCTHGGQSSLGGSLDKMAKIEILRKAIGEADQSLNHA
jgi:hypothetical protein